MLAGELGVTDSGRGLKMGGEYERRQFKMGNGRPDPVFPEATFSPEYVVFRLKINKIPLKPNEYVREQL